ncbi:MAG: hypothetical protein P4L99_28875 [Chthoniobacter sp.]|nr:hypothetical protein [Chthoniobacter sp.]
MSIDFSKYNDIISRLATEAISCSPPTWNQGTLTIDCDGSAIHYQLKSDADENKAQISPALRKLCEELYVAMRNNGNVWTQAVVSYGRKEESWGFQINFTYPPSQKTAGSAPPPLPPAVPPPLPTVPPPLP